MRIFTKYPYKNKSQNGCIILEVSSMEVRLEGITKSFGDFTAVNNLNVTIEDGTLAGLLGFTTRKTWNWISIPKLCFISTYDGTPKYHVPT